jgi:Ca-activated chloride channel family protein
MRFGNPQMLWLLLVTAPLLAWFLWWAWRRRQILIRQFVQSRLLAQLTVGISPLRQKIRLGLVVLAVACALLALARPQWGFDWEEAKQRGLDIVVAIDTSRSMLAEDIRPNRLARARLAALDLMNQAKSDRLALVPFAGAAFLQCPLTLDEQAFRQSVEALDVGIIPVGGTALTEAIETALTAYKEEGDNYKVLVLFTDGEDHDSGALEAAKKAASAGMKIFTVGIGTPNGELLRVTDEKGQANYIKDDQGNVVKSRLNETLLREIATTTGGFYLPLQGANIMETLYEKGLAPLPKSETSARLVRRYHERFQWPLALAIVALLLEMLLPERKRAPRAETPAVGASAGLSKAVAALLLLAVPFGGSASPSSAKRLYEDGRFKQAQQEYERLLEKSGKLPDLKEVAKKRAEGKQEDVEQEISRARENAKPGDLRLHYNAGAAAYKTGDLDQAALHFKLATIAPDLKLQERGYYNLGNTLYRHGEQVPDDNGKIQEWRNAVRSYTNALALDPQDADAKYNLELVKKRLEELEKQQPKQQQDKSQNQKQNQDKQDQKQDQKQQSNPDQQKEKQDRQKQQSKPDSRPQEQKDPRPQDSQPQKNAQNKKPNDQEQAKQNKPEGGGKGDDKSGEQSEANAAPTPGQMTIQEAQQLLDTQKGEERAMIFVPQQKLKDQRRPFKDW